MTYIRDAEDVASVRLRALAFIKKDQGEEDALPLQLMNPDRPDRTVFSSAYAALALSFDESPEAQAIRQKLVRYILQEREWPALWRYWGRKSLIPCDLDDLTLCPFVLEKHGINLPRTDWLLYLHRRREGQFYAWMMHGNVWSWNPMYWLLILRNFTPARLHFRYFGLWKTAGASNPFQYHVISNVHIVQYLGDTPRSAAAINWIMDTVREGREVEHEIYYRDPEFLYLGIGRAYVAGVKRFADIRDVLFARIRERIGADGQIGRNAFTTAAAVAALLHMEYMGPEVHNGISWLCQAQDAEGAWPAAGLDYAAAPPAETCWGSRALTTSVGVEALALYEGKLRSRITPDEVNA
jgi:hypothetical protein